MTSLIDFYELIRIDKYSDVFNRKNLLFIKHKKNPEDILIETVKKRLFVPQLFNGIVESDLLQPFPQINTDEREDMKFILDMVKRFAHDKIDPVSIDKEHHIPDSVKAEMAELGLWGLIIPEEFGGYEQSEFTFNKVLEILTGTCGATSVMYGGHLSIGLKAILMFGTDEQKRKFLPELASGEKIAGFALTEPDAGSDAASVKTTAVLSEDGKYYVLNGKKQWITNGGFADIFTVFAKVKLPGQDIDTSKMTAFIVTRDVDGVSVGKEEDKLGICGSSTTPLYFDNVKVPVENVIGEIGSGFNIAMAVLNTGRLGLGAGCVGAVKSIMKLALDFAMQRRQFKKLISEFEMVEEKFAIMTVNTFTAESMVYYTTHLKNNLNVNTAVESAICKIFSSEMLWHTIDDCLQIAGGNGFMKEYPFERFMRDARINLIFEGANDILRMMISVVGLQRPLVMLKKHLRQLPDDKTEKLKKIYELTAQITMQHTGYDMEIFSEQLQDQVKVARLMFEHLYTTVVQAVLYYGREIREMQYIQKRFADAVIHIYGILSNLLRIENLIQNQHASTKNAIVLSRIFTHRAQRVILQNLDDVMLNNDDELTKAAHVLYNAGKYPFEVLEY